MTRSIAAILLWMFMVAGAAAEPLYFVYLARIDSGKEADYQRFLDAVAPIWERHTMKVIMRAKIVEKHGDEEILNANEIGVLVVDSREHFEAYISDPDYQAIKSMRLNAVNRFTVLEGSSLGNEAQRFLRKTPLIAASLSVDKSVPSDANLTLNITLVAAVKGDAEGTIYHIKSVKINALSHDDNPSVHLPDTSSGAVLLIGENLLK